MRHVLLAACFTLLLGCSGGSDPQPQQTTTPQPTQAPSPPPATQPPAAIPIVNAGSDQTVHVGDVITLTGSSTTTDTKPTYLWHFTSLPAGSVAVLVNPDTLTPSFTADLSGLYVVALVLNDAQSDEVTITAQANLVTLHFHSVFATDSTIDGTFTYDTASGPINTNVRSLKPNVLYRLTAWDIAVTIGPTIGGLLPSTTYRSTDAGNTAEFCAGICIFSATQFLELRFANTGPTALAILFAVADPTPFINPPSGLSEWGAFSQGTYRIPCPVCVPLAVITSGTLRL